MAISAKDAIVVLGCRVRANGEPSGALLRRCQRAAFAFRDGLAPWVVVCGGKRWGGRSEADVMASTLERLGVPAKRIRRELISTTTIGNARHGARVLLNLNARRIVVVTCDFHATRALSAFVEAGFDAVVLSCPTPNDQGRLRRRLSESLFTVVQRGLAKTR